MPPLRPPTPATQCSRPIPRLLANSGHCHDAAACTTFALAKVLRDSHVHGGKRTHKLIDQASSSMPVSRVPIAPASRAVAVSSSSSGQLHSYRSLQKRATQHCARGHFTVTKWLYARVAMGADSMALLGARPRLFHTIELWGETVPAMLQQERLSR
jgi:hypothetical protein